MGDTVVYLPPGTLLKNGEYRIIKKRASGGFGCAYEAIDTRSDKRVAIKELYVSRICSRDADGRVTVPPEMQQWMQAVKTKFTDEAGILMRLDHKHIVKVTEMFAQNDTLYYVMDYIEGATLFTLVKRSGKVDERIAIKYISQIAEALAYLHSYGRLHLDIKPSNIMIDRKGNAKLIDFGISTEYGVDIENSKPMLLGISEGYSPSELLLLHNAEFVPASDVYSLGATLYFLVTGHRPLHAKEIAKGKNLDWSQTLVSKRVRNAITRAMHPLIEKRQQSVTELIHSLTGTKEFLADDNPDCEDFTIDPTTPADIEDHLRNQNKVGKILIYIMIGVLFLIFVMLVYFIVSYPERISEMIKNIIQFFMNL